MRLPGLKRCCGILTLVVGLALWADVPSGLAVAKRGHEVFFQNTDHELHVYRIRGDKPGPTLMLIGGIQGNEPGGHLSADSYADMSLKRGQLIVVPRANFYSIIKNDRGTSGDMNRKFNSATATGMDDQIVDILKKLMAESDYLLNLHDGSGFFSPEWVDELNNPNRYGQSIIVDADKHTLPNGTILDLGTTAKRVIEKVNAEIEHPKFHFKYNNHDTMSLQSIHREQRGSATFYALTKRGIPAFGVETSKQLPNTEMKIRHHNLAINAFMQEFGIIPENPGINLDPPVLKYVVVKVNEGLPVAVANHQTLDIQRGDTVTISHVQANYDRGLVAHIIGHGAFNNLMNPHQILSSTKVLVYKDNQRCGFINLRIAAETAAVPRTKIPTGGGLREVTYFVLTVNGQKVVVANKERIPIVRGDRLCVSQVLPDSLAQQVIVDFKGFAPPGAPNSGEDRGYLINTATDLQAKYSVNGQGNMYRIEAKHGKMLLGEITVSIVEPKLNYIILSRNDGSKSCYMDGETVSVNPDDSIKLIDFKTNVPTNDNVKVFIKIPRSAEEKELSGEPFQLQRAQVEQGKQPYEIVVTREKIPVGKIFIKSG
ncbi:MAG: hypothetical protein HQK58_10860 [Deltaproteobacteria bacterium]|nr:hypothetical protein [Deltaproteobacteria bacterium]